MHGGRVAAESAGPGRGSAFTLWVPAREGMSPAEEARATTVLAASEKKRVLVVDDNVDSAELVSEALNMTGYDTAMAHDGVEALEVADAFRPDIALVDIGLPRLDGYEVARRLQAAHPRAVLIALTGYGQPEDRRRTRDAGFHEHLTKPIELEKLAEVVDRATR